MALIKRYEISSVQNEKFRWLQGLSDSRNIREERACLVFGAKIVQEIVKQNRHRVIFQCVRGSDVAPGSHGDVLQLSPGLFDEIDVFGTRSPFLVIETPAMTKWNADTSPQGLVFVCPLQDPANLGAMARSAVAFGCQHMVLTKECASPFLPKAIRASAGAILNLHLSYSPSLTETGLQLETRKDVVGLDMAGTSIQSYQWPKDLYLILGEEGPGLPKFKIPRVSIPIQGVDSLNVMAAASIAAFSYRSIHGSKQA